MYSALGQLLLLMGEGKHGFVIAVPDQPAWERQLAKIPVHVKKLLRLLYVLVSPEGVRDL